VVAISGDGSFGLNAMEFDTAVHLPTYQFVEGFKMAP
jgi:hypothetical protein